MASKSKIKILFTIPNFDTAGSGKALLHIARRLDKDIFEPHICCMHSKGEFFKVVENSGIPVHVFEYTTPMVPRLRGLINALKISSKFRKIGPHIIHSFHYSSDYSEGLAARLAGIKWVFTKKNMSWGDNAWKLRIFFANGILAQNTDMLTQFFPGLQKVKLLPRGVDTTTFQPRAASLQILQELDIKPGGKVLISVANLVYRKGIHTLADAYALLKDKYPDVHILIVGEDTNDYAISLKEKVRSMGLEKNILFLGKKLNVADYISVADIFVLPSLPGEGSPVALLEAMACEKYVVAGAVPGITDTLRNFPEHMFISEDSSSLADKLKIALDQDEHQLKSKGRELRAAILENFTIEKEVKKHEEFYKEIVHFKS